MGGPARTHSLRCVRAGLMLALGVALAILASRENLTNLIHFARCQQLVQTEPGIAPLVVNIVENEYEAHHENDRKQ